jgi:hypothetical protein
LYDVTSTYFEGRTCFLAKYGYSRDGKRIKLQIVFGLLCNAEGCPVAVEVFEGNTADPKEWITALRAPAIRQLAEEGAVQRSLFDDDDQAAAAQRLSVVKPAQRSPRAQRKAQQQRTDDGWPVHSFRTLLTDLATLAKNRVRMKLPGALPFDKYTTPTPLQQRVFELLSVSYHM